MARYTFTIICPCGGEHVAIECMRLEEALEVYIGLAEVNPFVMLQEEKEVVTFHRHDKITIH